MRPIVLIFSLISVFFCLFSTGNESYQYVAMLPFCLFVFTLLDYCFLYNINRGFVSISFYLQAIIRYCLIPIGIASGDGFLAGENSSNGNTAIFLMGVELLVVYLFLLFVSRKSQYNIKFNNLILISKGIWPYIFIVVMFLIILSSGFFQRINFIWNLGKYVEDVIVNDNEIEADGSGGLFFVPFKILILLISTSLILKSKKSYNKKLVLLLILIGVMSSFIVGTSRLSIVVFVLPFYLILNSILDKKGKRFITGGLLAALVPILLVASLAKFTRGDNVSTTKSLLDTNSLNAYFTGVGNVAAGIDAFEKQEDHKYLLSFFNDVFQNIPLLSKLTDDTYKTNMVFNKEIYKHNLWQTQIVPLNISGLFHFNVYGVGCYTVLFLFLAMYFEKKGNEESYLPYKYIYYYLCLVLSMVFMINLGAMIATLFRIFFFTFMPFWIMRRLQKISSK